MCYYKICVGVRLDQLLDAWPFVLFPLVLMAGGFVVGYVFTKIAGIENKALRHSIILTVMFGNYGNLPFPLFETIAKEVYPFSADALAAQRAVAYGSVFVSVASLTLWSFGPWWVKRAREVAPSVQSSDVEMQQPSPNVANGNASSDSDQDASTGKQPPTESPDTEAEDSAVVLEDSPPMGSPITPMRPYVPLRRRLAVHASTWAQRLSKLPLTAFFTPTTIACLLAVAIVAIPPVHKSFFVETSPVLLSAPAAYNTSTPQDAPFSFDSPPPESDVPSKPPLGFISDAVGMLSSAAIPINLMLLGSNLYSTVKSQIARARISPSAQVLPLKKRILAGAVFTKLVVYTAVFFVIIVLFERLKLLPSDPMIPVILIIEGCSPSAINLVILAQLQDDQVVVEQLSTILLVQYLICTVTVFTTIAIGLRVFLG